MLLNAPMLYNRNITICLVGGMKEVSPSLKVILDHYHRTNKIVQMIFVSTPFKRSNVINQAGQYWCKTNGVKQVMSRPDFTTYGGKAIHWRNVELFESGKPDLIVNFDPALSEPMPSIMSTVENILSMARDRQVPICNAFDVTSGQLI